MMLVTSCGAERADTESEQDKKQKWTEENFNPSKAGAETTT